MMRNNLVVRIAIACLALGFTAIALGQHASPNSTSDSKSDSIDGKWTVTFTVQGQTVSGEMTFQAKGDKLGGSVETQHTGQGALTGGAWSHDKLSGIYVFQGHEAIAIAGEFRNGKLAGVFQTEGINGHWEAVRPEKL